MEPHQLLLILGAYAAALVSLSGLIWWLVKPRVAAWAQGILHAATLHSDQLAPGGDVHDNAATAAQAAAELPEIRARVEDIAAHGTALSQRHTEQINGLAMWREGLEMWREAVDRRLSLYEHALLALMGEELSKRIAHQGEEGNTR